MFPLLGKKVTLIKANTRTEYRVKSNVGIRCEVCSSPVFPFNQNCSRPLLKRRSCGLCGDSWQNKQNKCMSRRTLVVY